MSPLSEAEINPTRPCAPATGKRAGRRATLGLAAAVLLASSAGAMASNSISTTFQVDATVVSSCSVSATNHSFGNYDPLAVLPTTGTSSVTVQCTLLTAYNVGLNAGTGSGATVATRKMTKGSDTLEYSLYRDPTFTLVWGETVGSDTLAFIGTGLAVPHAVYGRIPAGQNVNTGTYSDTITVTVNF